MPQNNYKLIDFDWDRRLEELRSHPKRIVRVDFSEKGILCAHVKVKDGEVSFHLTPLGKIQISTSDSDLLRRAESILKDIIVCTRWVPKEEEPKEDDKHAFKLALRQELQELVSNISSSNGFRLFYSEEWLAHIPSDRRLLLSTDREWELLVDFYSKLQKRNEYAIAYQPYDPAITKSSTMAELDKQCVDAGLKALKEIEWDR